MLIPQSGTKWSMTPIGATSHNRLARCTDDGLGWHDYKGTIHLGKQSAGASQYQPVNRSKLKSLRISASQHIDLLLSTRFSASSATRDRNKPLANEKISRHKSCIGYQHRSTAGTIEFTTRTRGSLESSCSTPWTSMARRSMALAHVYITQSARCTLTLGRRRMHFSIAFDRAN